MTANHSDLLAKVNSLKWVHQIDLGNGIKTPGRWPPHPLILKAFDAIDFRGKTVLDIGTWDGLWAFEAERRGAAKVIATDLISQRSYRELDTFRLAHSTLNSRVEYHPQVSVYDVASLGIDNFDIVIFCGVYYHLRHPLNALSAIRCVMKDGGSLIVEGDSIYNVKMPMAWYLYTDIYSDDPSNWWIPSTTCLTQWITSCYFDVANVTSFDRSPGWIDRLKDKIKLVFGRWQPRVTRTVITASATRRQDAGYCFPDEQLARFDNRPEWME